MCMRSEGVCGAERKQSPESSHYSYQTSVSWGKNMTIGRSSKKNKSLRSSSFLDRASGFYGRLYENGGELWKKEVETEEQTADKAGEVEGQTKEGSTESRFLDEHDCGGFEFSQHVMEDDGATLLERKPSRWSQRWSRMSSRRTKTDKTAPSTCTETEVSASGNKDLQVASETQTAVVPQNETSEPSITPFSAREDTDDQVIFSEKKDRLMETEKKRRGEATEEKANGVTMKVVKRSGLRSYSKVLDRAVRRGWETFVSNLYSVTLTPVTLSSSSSSSSSAKSSMNRKSALIDYR